MGLGMGRHAIGMQMSVSDTSKASEKDWKNGREEELVFDGGN